MPLLDSKRHTRWTAAAIAALSILASACDDAPTSGVNAGTAVSASAPDALQRFSAAMAKALADPSLRTALHEAMKASQFSEHKLVLQEFAGTPAGARVIRAMAAAGKVDESVVRGWMQQLPSMDLYVPFVEHRRSWTGTGDLVVAANMDVDDTRFTGFAPDGTRAQFDSREGTPKPAVIFMHPAEDKAERDVAAENGARRTIEDPSRPVRTAILVGENGKAAPGSPRLSVSGAANYSGYLQSYKNFVGDGVGGIELYVQHYAGRYGSKIDGATIPEDGEYYMWGYAYDDVTFAHDQMWFSGSTDTWIKVHEKDQWSNDFWGEGKFNGFGSFVHRFYPTTLVAYVSFSDPCFSFSGSNCQDSYVDIHYSAN